MVRIVEVVTHGLATLEEIEYLLLKLFMVATQPLQRAIKHAPSFHHLTTRVVAPGADILLKSIEPYDPDLSPIQLSQEQWIKLGNAFHKWPFKPDVLEDETYIEDDAVEDMKQSAVFPNRMLTTSAPALIEAEEEVEPELVDDVVQSFEVEEAK
jgi:hypothetical protein